MNEKQVGQVWTKSNTLKSILLFLVHFVVFIGIALVVLMGCGVIHFGEKFSAQGANYLYAVFCIFLLFLIMYLYFFFESKEILKSGKNIALVFTILDLYLIISCLIGYNFAVYARPVALVALLTFVLIGRREAVFLNIISALLVFVIDTFAVEEVANQECYSSLIISFSAGMLSVFFASFTKTRLRVVLIGLLIVVPMDIVILLLETPELLNGNTAGQATVFHNIFTQMGYGLFGGVMSTVIFIAILPLFESAFNCLTAFRLR